MSEDPNDKKLKKAMDQYLYPETVAKLERLKEHYKNNPPSQAIREEIKRAKIAYKAQKRMVEYVSVQAALRAPKEPKLKELPFVGAEDLWEKAMGRKK